MAEAGRRHSSEVTRRSLAGFLVGGGVLAVLEILQQVVGAFDPRELVTVGIALAVALATTAAAKLAGPLSARGAAGRASARLATAAAQGRGPVAAGRLARAQAASGHQRGPGRVHRARVRRRAARALTESSFVLVYGPARAGKSRAAAEAARRALGDAPVIVPRSTDAFDALLDADLRLEFDGTYVVLWLDNGLSQRYDVLDATRLDALAGIAGGAKVVATIRTGEWEALLGAAGQRGEAAKAIAARARAFEVPDAVGSIDAERSTSGKDGTEPAPPPPAPERGVGQRSGWHERSLRRQPRGRWQSCSRSPCRWRSTASRNRFHSLSPNRSAILRDATRGDPDSDRDDRHTVIGGQPVNLQPGGGPSYVSSLPGRPRPGQLFRASLQRRRFAPTGVRRATRL